MVPVTTKPYLKNVTLPIMQRGFLPFFLLISEKINQHITSCENRPTGVTPFALRDIPIYYDERDNSTCASIFTSLDFGEFHWFPIPISELDSSTYKFHCAMLTKFESHYD